MRRRVVASKGSSARTSEAGLSGPQFITLDDRPLEIHRTADHKRLLVVMPYEVWVVSAATLEIEKTIELPHAAPTVSEAEEDGLIWIGGHHLHRGNLWTGTAAKIGSKLGGFVDRVCVVRPRTLCGVGSLGEVLWDVEHEQTTHRRKIGEHTVAGLVASADGRAVWIDGSSHAWVIDPDHPSGYMKLKLRATSAIEVPSEGIVTLAMTDAGRCIFVARDGAVAWTNRALRIVAERVPRADGLGRPLCAMGTERWTYVLHEGGVLHRFLVAQPPADPDAKEEAPALPEAQSARLTRRVTAIAPLADQLALAGPHADDQLGRLWLEPSESLAWEPLALRERDIQDAPRIEPEPASRKPNFTPTKSKLSGPPVSAIKVDDVLVATTEFWVTREHGSLLDRPTATTQASAVLPKDALLLPAMFRLHSGIARPGLVLWPGVSDPLAVLPAPSLLTWGDEPRAWLALQTPEIRGQGWSRREVFPLQVALRHPPPEVAGRRPAIPKRWHDPELFSALVRECKKLLKVLW